MIQEHRISVDELAAFMNVGWPGEDWYLEPIHEYLWEKTFTQGFGSELYRPHRTGQMISLADFEARVRYQGFGKDPTRGAGHRLSALFEDWREHQTSAVLSVAVPRSRLREVVAMLKERGCSIDGAADALALAAEAE